jgi:membrane protease YdiL (CAAX protease family)
VWGFVAVSAGFCEEVVYRGYLQTQLTAFAGYWTVGAFAQAVLFGIAHGEQDALVAARFAFYGLILGILCSARQSLAAAIICHVSPDFLSGISMN